MPLPPYRGNGLSPTGEQYAYRASEPLVRAVNYALRLNKPLLVQGEPGCGKTELARAIAHELGITAFHRWNVKSTSKARDGLYEIDTLRRLHDAQLENPDACRLQPYVQYGPLGEALRTPGESIVLIDEIDKADPDFPNDLLYELENQSFEISGITEEDRKLGFTGTYERVGKPILVITNNDERELPDAFLRRCIFHWIEVPRGKQLEEIVHLHFPEPKWEDKLLRSILDQHEKFRAISGMRKPPATDELLDWLKILRGEGVDAGRFSDQTKLAELPSWEMLFKHKADIDKVRQASREVSP